MLLLGPPASINGLHVTSNSNNNILLSWSASFSPFSVAVTYSVKVEKDGEELLHSSNTSLTTFFFTPPEGICSLVKFVIQAFNSAGRSNESIITYKLLTSMYRYDVTIML